MRKQELEQLTSDTNLVLQAVGSDSKLSLDYAAGAYMLNCSDKSGNQWWTIHVSRDINAMYEKVSGIRTGAVLAGNLGVNFR